MSLIIGSNFIPFDKLQSKNQLLPYVASYFENQNLHTLYIALSIDKNGDEVVCAAQLHDFIENEEMSVSLKLFFDKKSPSNAALNYDWPEGRVIIRDLRSVQRRIWHGSILLKQSEMLCKLLNLYTESRSKKFIAEHKDNAEILEYVNNKVQKYVKPLIKTLEGEIFPDNTLTEEELTNFYTANNAVKNNKVYILIE